jgi:hypothetical protein
MKVKDLIEQLTRYNKMDDEIIVDYIDHDDVNGWFEDSFTDDEWKKFVIESEKANMSNLDSDLLYYIAKQIYKGGR